MHNKTHFYKFYKDNLDLFLIVCFNNIYIFIQISQKISKINPNLVALNLIYDADNNFKKAAYYKLNIINYFNSKVSLVDL